MSLSKCKSCGAAIVWLRTKNDKPMPCDSSSVTPGETKFLESSRHVPHWQTCPSAKTHKAQPGGAQAHASNEQLSLLDDGAVSGSERLSAGGYVTGQRAAALRNLLREHGIPGAAFAAIRKAAGYNAPVEHWDEDTYTAVLALAIHTATSMQAAQHGLPAYLALKGHSEQEVAAAQAAFDAMVAGRRVG